MNWEAIGAVGELVGAFAVVITLAYLAIQVRYAKMSASDVNRLTRASGVRESYLKQAGNPALGMSLVAVDPNFAAFIEGYVAEFGVSQEQAASVDAQNQYYFWLHWGQYASTKTSADLEELRNLVAGYYSVPYVNYSWRNSPYAKSLLEPRFVAFVDEILAQSGGASPPA